MSSTTFDPLLSLSSPPPVLPTNKGFNYEKLKRISIQIKNRDGNATIISVTATDGRVDSDQIIQEYMKSNPSFSLKDDEVAVIILNGYACNDKYLYVEDVFKIHCLFIYAIKKKYIY